MFSLTTASLNFNQILQWTSFLRVLVFTIAIIALYLIFVLLLDLLKRKLLKKLQRKKERSNVKVFIQASKYFIFVLLLIFGILSYTGSLGGIGVTAGLLTAALGWALQRPITGIAGWIMVVLKRPFYIGDRINIGSIKGDVAEISLTHIHLNEIGGTIASEEISGRVILIPNSRLFEVDIINYTKSGEEILDTVRFTITFESDLRAAKKIAESAAKNILRNYEINKNLEPPYSRVFFQPQGIEVQLRYFSLAAKREEISSAITEEIIKTITKTKNVALAYPQGEIIIKNKSS